MKGAEQQAKATDKVGNSAASANGVDAPALGPEATINQVRDLLFGGAQRSIESNLAGLRDEMQALLTQLQADFTRDLAAVHAKVQELERDTEQKRLASLKDVGSAISQLGAAISGLGTDRTGR